LSPLLSSPHQPSSRFLPTPAPSSPLLALPVCARPRSYQPSSSEPRRSAASC
jgi:hypothetical protein